MVATTFSKRLLPLKLKKKIKEKDLFRVFLKNSFLLVRRENSRWDLFDNGL